GYNLDVINLQETYLSQQNIEYIKKNIWKHESFWTSKVAILAGNKNIHFKNVEEIENGITASFLHNNRAIQVTNIYVPFNDDRRDFFNNWIPGKRENSVNVIVGEFNTSIGSIYSQNLNQLSDFTNVVKIVGEKSLINCRQKNFPSAMKLDYIFIDNDYANFCQKIKTHFRFSKPLVVCTLETVIWRLNKKLLDVPIVEKRINKEITSVNSVLEWDHLKKNLQSVFCHYKHKAFEKQNDKSTDFDLTWSDVSSDISHLEDHKIQEDLIKAGWGEKKERSTSKIQDPSDPTSNNPINILSYIKTYYQELFKKDNIDSNLARKITDELPSITEDQNNSLIETITCEEVSNTIAQLKNDKSPGIDGLPFEFYKKFQEKLVPLLGKIFNQILKT
ncbi:1086_t:CDS:1, partial [Racocetra fulgida]